MTRERSRILVVDDEIKICQNCVQILSKLDYEVRYALNGHDALQTMMDDGPFDIVITDLKMSRLGGMEVLHRVRKSYPDTMVIVITGYATVSSAVEVMKTGAYDFLPKPFTPDELRAVVRQALSERIKRIKNQKFLTQRRPTGTLTHQLIGNSKKMKKVIQMVQKVAPTDSTVLIYGESGTGKELIARAIHANSNRKKGVFFAVDCGTLSDNLLESELFGYTKGAFTGANRDKAGIFMTADAGTVFLDEISNISIEVQGKLLRFLENHEFLPLGGRATQKVDIRMIFATNQDLKEMVEMGNFREDFYYRIFVYPIFVPPLRERKEDILPIAYHFLHQFNHNMGKNIQGFRDDVSIRMTEYEWPGNVRQLRNVIERAVILCERELIGPNELNHLGGTEDALENIPETNQELKQLKKAVRERATAKLERNFLLNALLKNNWNVTQAAKKVGIQRTNFQSLMKKHGISRPKVKTGKLSLSS